MRLPDLFHTTVFRWTAALALAFAGLALLFSAFVYWQTAAYERLQVDRMLVHEAQLLAADPEGASAGLVTWLREDLHNVRYGILSGRDGKRIAGNMPAVPQDLRLDGAPQAATTAGRDADADDKAEAIRAVGLTLADGRVLALGNDTDELDHTTAIILRALGLGLLPMLGLSLMGALLLGRRAVDRVARLDTAMRAVRRGGLRDRLPVSDARDEFDRMAAGINAMLDEIARLVDEIRVVGDSVAHDLRTPLTRVHARLEGARNRATTLAECQVAIDEALEWLDGTFDMITAVLRIGEIEHGRRQAGFAPLPLVAIMTEAADLYGPLADEKGIVLHLDLEAACDNTVDGDRDLVFEAISNLIDNAVKFTPRHGNIHLILRRNAGSVVLAVADDGAGIDAADRPLVVRRFFRGERSRHSAGNGLGLAFVAAVAALHNFEFRIDDNHPGCHAALHCPARGAAMGDPAAAPDANEGTPFVHDRAAELEFRCSVSGPD